MPTDRASTELIVALDYPSAASALELVDALGSRPLIYKVGFELFVGHGPELVRELLHRKSRVFLDLKLYDIPNTVRKAALQAARLHVEMLTVHLAGGQAMIAGILDEFRELPELRPKLLGVTVLTSFSDTQWAEVTRAVGGHASQTTSSVDRLVEAAARWGVDGVVCSPLEVAAIRKTHPHLYSVVPGIRPAGAALGDQARVMTPADAARAGASAIVVGRPITQAPSLQASAEMVDQILFQLKEAHVRHP